MTLESREILLSLCVIKHLANFNNKSIHNYKGNIYINFSSIKLYSYIASYSSISIYLSVCLSLSLYIYIFIYICVCVCESLCVCVSVCGSIGGSVVLVLITIALYLHTTLFLIWLLFDKILLSFFLYL